MSYDYMGRRFEKIVIVEGNIEASPKFVYNDYLQIAELSRENTLMRRYFWDPTAGMASRLLMIDDISLNRRLFLTHDANKNVTGLIEQSGNVAAHYEYHAFGFPTALSPFDSQAPSAQYETSYLNYFLFSSEFYDYELSMSYYNYRHYNPLDGRWLSRDPIEEKGGYNLYGMVNNNSINFIDLLGKITREECYENYEACCESCRKYSPNDWFERQQCWVGCMAIYSTCINNIVVETLRDTASSTCRWIKDHPEAVVGTIVVIGATVYIVATCGAGGLILVPLAAI